MATFAVTGTQKGRSEEDAARACESIADQVTLLLTGGCIGVDAQVALWFGFNRPEIPQHVYLPTAPRADRSKRSDYWFGDPFGNVALMVVPVEGDELARNRAMVNACDELLALPDGPEIRRSGTWSTVRHARRLRRPIHQFDRARP